VGAAVPCDQSAATTVIAALALFPRKKLERGVQRRCSKKTAFKNDAERTEHYRSQSLIPGSFPLGRTPLKDDAPHSEDRSVQYCSH
jgi:hypothetical protein